LGKNEFFPIFAATIQAVKSVCAAASPNGAMYKSQPLRALLPLLVLKYAAKGFGRFLQTALHAF